MVLPEERSGCDIPILHVGAHGRPDRVPEMTPTGLVFKWSVLEQREAWPVTATRL
jgi:hypothetical protein